MNMFKKNGGFTLVELIVVIAILAILAGVAVPAYSGYIARANDAACLSELSAIQTAAQAACSLNGSELSGISIATNSITVTGNPEDEDITADFNTLYTTDVTVVAGLVAKHSNYSKLTGGVSWAPATGWNLLAEPAGEGD